MFFLIKRRFTLFMNRLNFAPITDAFHLGSEQIKNTQEEINKLRKIIGDGQPPSQSQNGNFASQNGNILKKEVNQPKESMQRVGYSDSVVGNFSSKNDNGNFDTDLLKVMQHPKFDDIVKNYIVIKHPEWVNTKFKDTSYVPNEKSTFGNRTSFLKEGFGNVGNNPETQKYIIFFLVSLLLYTFLKKLFKN